MQVVAPQSRSWCFISINHEAGVDEMPVGVALRLTHTDERQQNVLNGGVSVMWGVLHLLKVVSQKVSTAFEPHITM